MNWRAKTCSEFSLYKKLLRALIANLMWKFIFNTLLSRAKKKRGGASSIFNLLGVCVARECANNETVCQ